MAKNGMQGAVWMSGWIDAVDGLMVVESSGSRCPFYSLYMAIDTSLVRPRLGRDNNAS